MIILITGTPGTGKTTISAEIGRKYNIPVFNVHEEAIRLGLVTERDEERNSDIISEDAIELILSDLSKEHDSYVLEGLLSHYSLPSKDRLCLVIKCDISELNRRLILRNYDGVKIRENVDSEIFRIIEIEAEESGHNLIVYDNTTLKKNEMEKLFMKIKEFQDNISSK